MVADIGTHMLLIITSTGDKLLLVSTSMTLNDPEPPKWGFVLFFAICGCGAHFKSELRRNGRI